LSNLSEQDPIVGLEVRSIGWVDPKPSPQKVSLEPWIGWATIIYYYIALGYRRLRSNPTIGDGEDRGSCSRMQVFFGKHPTKRKGALLVSYHDSPLVENSNPT
jgi:hypothetical protein